MILIKNVAIILFILSQTSLNAKCDGIENVLNSKNLDYILNKEKETTKPKLTIAFMLPQDILRTRNNRQCINKEIMKIRQSNSWGFTKHFYLDR